MRAHLIWAGVLLAVSTVPAARAQSAAEIGALRQDIQNLRDEYGARLQALEARLAAAESRAATPQALQQASQQSSPQSPQSPQSPPDPVTDSTDAAAGAPVRRGAQLDPLIDAIVPIQLEQAVSGEMVLMHMPPTRRAGTKPFAIEGLNAESGNWEMPQPGQRYRELQAGVQLANRSGALNAIEYSEFVQKLQPLADALGAMLEPPEMTDAVAHAKELDAFAGAHDAQLAVTLRANAAAWSVGYIQQCAGRHGFVPGLLPGRLVMPAPEEGAPPVLVITFSPQAALADDPNLSALREITLSLDVPQTPAAAEPFPAWQQAARALATDMGATLVDGQGYPVTLHAFAGIGADLEQLYRALEQRELAAGSPVARRLFS